MIITHSCRNWAEAQQLRHFLFPTATLWYLKLLSNSLKLIFITMQNFQQYRGRLFVFTFRLPEFQIISDCFLCGTKIYHRSGFDYKQTPCPDAEDLGLRLYVTYVTCCSWLRSYIDMMLEKTLRGLSRPFVLRQLWLFPAKHISSLKKTSHTTLANNNKSLWEVQA